MKVFLWSWTDVRLSCGVLWKSFHSFDNSHTYYIKASGDAVNLKLALMLGKWIPWIVLAGIWTFLSSAGSL